MTKSRYATVYVIMAPLGLVDDLGFLAERGQEQHGRLRWFLDASRGGKPSLDARRGGKSLARRASRQRISLSTRVVSAPARAFASEEVRGRGAGGETGGRGAASSSSRARLRPVD